MPKYKTLKPLKLKSSRLPVQFSIIVPATEGKTEISTQRFNQRLLREKKYLDNIFGGDTSIVGRGSSKVTSGKGKPVIETVGVVEASTTPRKFIGNKRKITEHIKDRQKRWKQNTILYKIEGETFIYPKRKFISDAKIKSDILIT